MSNEVSTRGRRRKLQGVVTSTKMQKTITVLWQRQVRHQRFGKFVQRHTKLHAHDEQGTAKVGDLVEIMETRPISKMKRWRLVRVVRTGSDVRHTAATA
ncbi:MAG: 30S ribosomal protein S17 [Planctomycetes bacterium]|nr:30S ribosomal protein S17 [Planctomycetota bacterium]NUQ35617.1 30S ribosomal protein S17 [Planctomycetaceae bacterium]